MWSNGSPQALAVGMQIGTIITENVQQFLIKLKISIPPYPQILYLGSQMKDYTIKANTVNKIRVMVPSRRRGAEMRYEGRRPFSENIFFSLHGDSEVALVVKNSPANVRDVKMQAQSLSGEDPLEKGTATHASILAWRIHGQRSLVGYSPWGCKELNMT